jgi:hypothetical protein
MTWLMRWRGLRIRYALTLEKTRLHGDSLILYQAKTSSPVYAPLPSFLVEAPGEPSTRGETESTLFFGVETVRLSAPLQIGKEVSEDSSSSLTSRGQTDPRSVATRICSGTHSRWRCFSLIEFRFFSVTPA